MGRRRCFLACIMTADASRPKNRCTYIYNISLQRERGQTVDSGSISLKVCFEDQTESNLKQLGRKGTEGDNKQTREIQSIITESGSPASSDSVFAWRWHVTMAHVDVNIRSAERGKAASNPATKSFFIRPGLKGKGLKNNTKKAHTVPTKIKLISATPLPMETESKRSLKTQNFNIYSRINHDQSIRYLKAV